MYSRVYPYASEPTHCTAERNSKLRRSRRSSYCMSYSKGAHVRVATQGQARSQTVHKGVAVPSGQTGAVLRQENVLVLPEHAGVAKSARCSQHTQRRLEH